MILSAAMMLEWLGETQAAKLIEDAVIFATSKKLKSLAAGKMGYSTSEVGDLLADYVFKNAPKERISK